MPYSRPLVKENKIKPTSLDITKDLGGENAYDTILKMQYVALGHPSISPRFFNIRDGDLISEVAVYYKNDFRIHEILRNIITSQIYLHVFTSFFPHSRGYRVFQRGLD